MLFKFKSLVQEDDGAVTVDWVVLTAAIVGLGVAVVSSVQTATVNLGANINERIISYTE